MDRTKMLLATAIGILAVSGITAWALEKTTFTAKVATEISPDAITAAGIMNPDIYASDVVREKIESDYDSKMADEWDKATTLIFSESKYTGDYTAVKEAIACIEKARNIHKS